MSYLIGLFVIGYVATGFMYAPVEKSSHDGGLSRPRRGFSDYVVAWRSRPAVRWGRIGAGVAALALMFAVILLLGGK